MMHRTQIYFEESLFQEVRKKAVRHKVSVSAYIRDVIRRDLEDNNQEITRPDYSEFAGMWSDKDISQEKLRNKAWK